MIYQTAAPNEVPIHISMDIHQLKSIILEEVEKGTTNSSFRCDRS